MATPKFGDLGVLVLPIGWITIVVAIFVLITGIIKSSIELFHYLVFIFKINFDISQLFSYSWFGVEIWLFKIFSSPLVLFTLLSFLATVWYMNYAEEATGKVKELKRNLGAFFLLFGPIFTFWWIKSFLKLAFKHNIKWR